MTLARMVDWPAAGSLPLPKSLETSAQRTAKPPGWLKRMNEVSNISGGGRAAIALRGVSKFYCLYDKPADRLKQAVWGYRRRYYREFWALRDVSLEVRRGETLAIIGRNGSGKSTLLQIVCGTLAATSGEVETHGALSALLELGAGFNMEFTGRENVFLSASLLGLSRERTRAILPAILEFAAIGDFIDQPVKTYSKIGRASCRERV